MSVYSRLDVYLLKFTCASSHVTHWVLMKRVKKGAISNFFFKSSSKVSRPSVLKAKEIFIPASNLVIGPDSVCDISLESGELVSLALH